MRPTFSNVMHNSNFDAPVLRKKSIVFVSTKYRKLTNDKGNLNHTKSDKNKTIV
jgi:hypothetical protein